MKPVPVENNLERAGYNLVPAEYSLLGKLEMAEFGRKPPEFERGFAPESVHNHQAGLMALTASIQFGQQVGSRIQAGQKACYSQTVLQELARQEQIAGKNILAVWQEVDPEEGLVEWHLGQHS